MATQSGKEIVRYVKPLLSANAHDARKKVLTLYKMWYREIPAIILIYNLPLTLAQARDKLRSEFRKHQKLTDTRAIDMLVIKGQMEFKETMLKHKQRCQLLYKFCETEQPKSFMGKFLSGDLPPTTGFSNSGAMLKRRLKSPSTPQPSKGKSG